MSDGRNHPVWKKRGEDSMDENEQRVGETVIFQPETDAAPLEAVPTETEQAEAALTEPAAGAAQIETVAPAPQDEYISRLEMMAKAREEERKPKKKPLLLRLFGYLMLAILMGAIGGGTYFALDRYLVPETPEQRPVSKTDIPDPDEEKGPVNLGKTEDLGEIAAKTVSAVDVSAVAESVMPAVVAINNYATQTDYDFWSGKSVTSEQLKGSGSGIIIGQNENEVLIVTNNHVISGATRLEIQFCDGTTSEGRVKGRASSSDLAVVAVSFTNLSRATAETIRVARIGSSDDVKVGQMAIAIGNALGYGQSVTVGYISALNRTVTIDGQSFRLIQTDAAINPGNSGGALLNQKGEVIAINSAKYSDYAVEGMGFAIPISNVREIIDELSSREILSDEDRGYLGLLATQDVTASISASYGIPQGVYVQEIEKDSAVDKGGMLVGDIIVRIGKDAVTCIQDIRDVMSYSKAGEKITVTVSRRVRNGEFEEVELSITLGHYPVQQTQS